MPYIVDIYGTKTVKFGDFDSDVAQLGGYIQGDTIYRDGVIYTATTDIPANTPFVVADSEGREKAWFKAVVGTNSAEAQSGDSEIWNAIYHLEGAHDSDVRVAVHNYLADDSDIAAYLERDHDSDIAVAVHNYLANDSDFSVSLTQYVHDYLAADSDLNDTHGADIDSDIARTNHDFRAADSDLFTTVQAVLDSDLPRLEHDFKAADSELFVTVQNVLDSDLPRLEHDYQAADSDLLELVTGGLTLDLDSEIHDRKAADSDFRVQYDSDVTTIYHDYQAADSDLFVTVQNVLDSDLPKLEHDFKAADSDLRADIDSDGTTIRHDYQAADSDLFTQVQNVLDSDLPRIVHDSLAGDSDLSARIDDISFTLGRFTKNDSDSTDIFREPGWVQWLGTTGSTLANSYFEVFTPRGFVRLPADTSTTAFADLGFQTLTGTGKPTAAPTNSPAKGVYTDKAADRLWVWDSSIKLDQWQEVFFGSNVHLTEAAAKSEVSPSGDKFGFWFRVPDSDAAPDQNGGLYVTPYWWTSFNAVTIESIQSVASTSNLLALWNPPSSGGTDQSSFPTMKYAYVRSTKRFAYVGDAIGTNPDNTWTYQSIDTLVTEASPKPSNYLETEIANRLWDDGATYFDKVTRKLWLREVLDTTAEWVSISGDISQADYDSDISVIRHNILARDSEQTLGSLFDVSYEDSDSVNKLEDGAALVYDSETSKWTPRLNTLENLYNALFKTSDGIHGKTISYDSDLGGWVTDTPPTQSSSYQRIDTFTITAGDSEFTLSETPLGDVRVTRNGVVLPEASYTLDVQNRKVNYVSAGNQGDVLDSDDEIQISYVWATASSSARLGDLLDVDPNLVNPTHGEMFMWDSDSETWKGAFLEAGELAIETFTATQGQTVFNLSNASSGGVQLARNGVMLPGPSVSLSVDHRTVNYNAANNEGSVIDSDDVITCTYMTGAMPVGWAPTALGNMSDVNVEQRQNGSMMWYSDSEQGYAHVKFPTDPTTFVSELNRDSFDVRYNMTSQEIEYSEKEYHHIRYKSAQIQATSGDWLSVSNSANYDAMAIGNPRFNGTVFSLDYWKKGGTYEIQVDLKPEAVSAFGATGVKLTWELATYSGSPQVVMTGYSVSAGHSAFATEANKNGTYSVIVEVAPNTAADQRRWALVVNSIDIEGSAASYVNLRDSWIKVTKIK